MHYRRAGRFNRGGPLEDRGTPDDRSSLGVRSCLDMGSSLDARCRLDAPSSFDTRSRANCVDTLQGRFVERPARHGPLAALRGQDDLDPIRSGNALAQSTADAESAFDNFLER